MLISERWQFSEINIYVRRGFFTKYNKMIFEILLKAKDPR